MGEHIQILEGKQILSSYDPTDKKQKTKDETLYGLVGEVKVDPTANTVLARLKDLTDAIVVLNSKIDTLDAVVDSLKDTDGIKKITDAVTVTQNTHDNMNINANLQVNNTDVANINPVPATLTGSNAFVDGNPYPISKGCTLANTNYDIDVNAGLGRNGHFGLIQAHENNTGVVSVWVSYNGASFTASAIARLQAGASLTLDGLDIDTIRVQSTVAGDDVLGGVW